MVEPVTLGVIIAALVAKALDRAEDEAVDRGAGVMRRAVGTLREWFSRQGDAEGQLALERVADVSDSPKLVRTLAELLDERAERFPEFRAELQALKDEAQGAGLDIGTITQMATGDGNVQIAGTNNSQINVDRGPASRPRE
jgi:hypothetical protein